MNLEKKLRKENNLQEKQLTTENNRILTDMIVYMHSSNLCEYDIEVFRKELIGTILESQYRNTAMEDVIGEDYRTFCDELIQSGRTKTSFEKVLEVLYSILWGTAILFSYEIVSFLFPKIVHGGIKSMLMQLPISLGFAFSTICAVLVAYGFVFFVTKKSFEFSESRKSRYIFALFILVPLVGMTLARLLWDTIILFSVNIFIIILFFILAVTIVTILNNKHSNDLAKTHS